jgi:hypothetical protein
MRLALTLALALAGCAKAADPDPFYPAVPSTDPAKENDENDIRVIAFTHLLRRATSGDVCFIAFQEPGIKGWIYPSDQFMSRLAFPQLILRKVNEALHPKPNERDPNDPKRYQGIRDPKTGARCDLYWVRLEWLTPDRVKAHAGLTDGPLSGGGSELIIVREKDGWVFKETAGRWVH